MFDPDREEGGINPSGNTQEISQAEGDENLGETDIKVGHTPDQAEGEEEDVEE